MSGRKTEAPRRRRSDRGQAYTWPITVTPAQVELLERARATGYSIMAGCMDFRSLSLSAFYQGLKALRAGYEAGELVPDAESPVFGRSPRDFEPRPRRLLLSEEETAITVFLTDIDPIYGDPKAFQQKAEAIMELGISRLEELIRGQRESEGPRAAPEEPEEAPQEQAARVRWPRKILKFPTPTADDLPQVFGEE